MNNIDVNKIEFGGLDQDGNTWRSSINGLYQNPAK